MRTRWFAVAALAVSAVGIQVRAQAVDETTPKPEALVEGACRAAGGWESFQRLGVLKTRISQEEVTQDGKVQKSESTYTTALPGPTPVRFEIKESGIVAGDDGQKGWAVVNGKPDSRPITQVMVRRLVQSDLFSLLLPFSLRWDGVIASSVQPAVVKGRPVWRLTVEFQRTFFSSPQTATRWTVDMDRRTYEVVGAESPATDLGRGITADGLRFAWSKPVQVGGVTLRGIESVVGIDGAGLERSHTRVRNLSFELLAGGKAMGLFDNPTPESERPKPPAANVPPPALPPTR